MRHSFDVALAESHRSSRFVDDSELALNIVRIGERGWRNDWIETPPTARRLVVVDDGARIREISWALRTMGDTKVGIGFLVETGNSDRALKVVGRVGWSHRRSRRRNLAYFESPADQVTEQALRLALHDLGDGEPTRGGSPRVVFAGARSKLWLGDWEPTWSVDGSPVRTIVELTDGHLDLLLVDADDHPAPMALSDLVDDARTLGAKVAAVTEASRDVVQGVEFDLVLATNPDTIDEGAVGPGVDVRIVNPEGFTRDTSLECAAVVTRLEPMALARGWDATDTEVAPPTIIPAHRLMAVRSGDSATDPAELVKALRPFRAVVDHPLFHRTIHDRARLICWLACGGVPLVVHEIGEGLTSLLGGELSTVLGEFSLRASQDEDRREFFSVELRRSALRTASTSARFREIGRSLGLALSPMPTVSVVMATRRPEYLDRALGLMNRQSYPDLELVIALHGSAFDNEVEKRVRMAAERDVTVLRVGDDRNLGETLNLAMSQAGGQVLSKWDDDDWYSPEHIWDVVLALEYSGADIVGKAAEFVYLADLDITIRRFPQGADSPSKTIGGGTLTADRDVLRSVGGFPNWPHHVDQGLLGAIVDQGGVSFRTHGFGYLLNRHGDHTWDVETDYFLDASFRQWRGLDLTAPGIDAGSAVMS